MKSLYIGILMVFLFPVLLVAKDNTPDKKNKSDANITGHVESAKTKEHLTYVTIAIKGTTIGISTDATGHYFLKNMPEGEFTITASAVGFKTQEQKINTVTKKTIEVNFLLNEEAIIMDEVVVTSSRNETNKRNSAAIVNIASAKLFENVASSSLAETMNFQSGLRVENNCGNCGSTQLRINGLDGQYSQILLDSRPIFSSLASMYGLEQLPVSMIERVEIVRGGGSALFGSSAIGGVVNIITKEPLRNSVSLTNTTNIFDDGKTDINTSFNGSFVSDDHKAGVYIFGMLKNKDWYDYNGDGFSDITGISSETAGFRGYYKLTNYSRLTAEYHHIHEFRRGGNNFDLPPHEADIAEQLNHKIDGGGLRFDVYTPNYKHRISIYTSAQNIKRDSYFGIDKNPDSYGHTKDKTFVAGVQYTYAFEKFIFMPSELTTGIEYNYNDLHDKFFGLQRDIKQTTHITGGFIQNEWKTEKLNILLGTRFDKHNMMDKIIFNPRANVRYSPTEQIGLRVSYSSGYRAPQAYNEDLHIDAVSGVLSLIRLVPGLKPEYSHSLSASADVYHNFGRLQTNFLVEGFYTLLNDVFKLEEVGKDSAGNYIMERRNASGAAVKGINFEAKLGIPGLFDIQMGYTLQQSRYKEPEKWADELEAQRTMFRSPNNYAYITSNINIIKQFKGSVFANYTGYMLVKHIFEDVKSEKTTPSFFDIGAKLSYTFNLSGNLNIEFNGGVKNIFNSFQKDLDYGPMKDAAYVYGPSNPRMIFIGGKIML